MTLYGVLSTSSTVVYGFNKKGMSMKRFMAVSGKFDKYIIVPTKYPLLSYDLYVSVNIVGEKGNNIIATIDQYFGKVGDIVVECLFLKKVYHLCYKKYDKNLINTYIFDRFNNDRVKLNDYVITIDPENSIDLDDAISFKKTTLGYIVNVHIADVAAYIQEGSELDEIIKSRASSTYLYNEVIHLLPSELVAIYSLNTNDHKAVITCELIYEDNCLVSHRFYRSLVKIAENLSYEKAQSILDVHDTIKTLSNISGQLDTHKIIEHFMILTNSLVANEPNIIIRTQEQGMSAKYEYKEEIGEKIHYTMNIEHNISQYTHFTSPIRRYPDLIASRQLLKNECVQLPDLNIINDRMRIIKKAQNDSIKLKIAYDIHNNYKDMIIENAVIIGFVDNLIELDIAKCGIRARFKLFPQKIKKTLEFRHEVNKIVLNDVALEVGQTIVVKIISNVLKPFIKNKLLFQIVEPEILFC
jgi:exoribonuclease R